MNKKREAYQWTWIEKEEEGESHIQVYEHRNKRVVGTCPMGISINALFSSLVKETYVLNNHNVGKWKMKK